MTVEMVLMFLFYLNFPNNLMKKEKAYKKATIDRLINTKYISEMKTLYLRILQIIKLMKIWSVRISKKSPNLPN